jgi:hypothetical protein
MARSAIFAFGLLATASEASEQVLFQRKGQLASKSGVSAQLSMVQELARDVVQHKRPLTDGEKTILNTIDETIIGPNLVDITNAHKSDAGILQGNADDVAACETDLDGKAKVAADMNATATAEWAKHASCLVEQARLKGEMEAAKGRLDDFLQASTDALPSCTVPGAEAAVEDVEAMMDANAKWYNDHDKTYGVKLADWNARIATHDAKVEECLKQRDLAQQRTCEWRAFVVASTGEYDACRTRTLATYADTLATNQGNSKDHKAEWDAMKHLQCYIATLRADITATGEKLAHCESEVVDTSALDVVEPAVAPKAEGKVAAMGDMSRDYGCSQ